MKKDACDHLLSPLLFSNTRVSEIRLCRLKLLGSATRKRSNLGPRARAPPPRGRPLPAGINYSAPSTLGLRENQKDQLP